MSTASSFHACSDPVVARAAEDAEPGTAVDSRSYFQRFPSLFGPIYGGASGRKTIKRRIAPNVFVLEQSLVLGPLETPLRCVVVRLDDGSLWVHCPLAPTEEFFRLVESCGERVAHVVVPTYALEHKIFAKDALRRWPSGRLWTSPDQFTFPRWWWWWSTSDELVWGRRRVDGVLADSDSSTDRVQPPWTDEIQYETLTAGTFNVGGTPTALRETTFYHKASSSLIVTDAVAKIGTEPGELSDPKNLLLVSKRSTSDETPVDTTEARRVGWAKNALLISYFFPEHEELDPNKLGVVTWTDGWETNFERLSDRLIVPPVVRTLLYRQNPAKVKQWVERVTSRWEFDKIIPAHWEAPIPSSPNELKRSFRFLDDDTVDPFPANDLKRGLKPLADLALGALS